MPSIPRMREIRMASDVGSNECERIPNSRA
jgi:hypothetical protein